MVKRRVVSLVSGGASDERGGIDMAKLAPGYKRAFNEALDARCGEPALRWLRRWASAAWGCAAGLAAASAPPSLCFCAGCAVCAGPRAGLHAGCFFCASSGYVDCAA